MTKFFEYEDTDMSTQIYNMNYETIISYKKNHIDSIEYPKISTMSFEEQTRLYLVCSTIINLYSNLNTRSQKSALYSINEYASKICKKIRKPSNPDALHFYYIASRCIAVLPENPNDIFNFYI